MSDDNDPQQNMFNQLFPCKLTKAFLTFHLENPSVYSAIVGCAFQMLNAGRSRYGMKSIFEVVRWHRNLTTTDEDFKICNNHAPFYARMIMRDYPEFENFFVLKKSVADDYFGTKKSPPEMGGRDRS